MGGGGGGGYNSVIDFFYKEFKSKEKKNSGEGVGGEGC